MARMVLNPTPPDRLCDAAGHPYFLWDNDQTLEEFKDLLAHPDPTVRAHAIGKLMRQARTDDALALLDLRIVERDWSLIVRHLGRRRAFWTWLIPELLRRAA